MTPAPPSQQAVPAPHSSGRLAFKITLWIVALFLLGAAWILLLARVAPSRLDVSSVSATLFATTPPFLATLLLWTGVQRFSTLSRLAGATPPTVAPSAPPAAAGPVARFRIGAWCALTPHGSAIETLGGTTERSKRFNPDKEILHPSGFPAHAAMIGSLELESLGHPAKTRKLAPRVMAMLCAVLDDLHAQQGLLVETIPGPASVYWMMPPAMQSDGVAETAIFAAAWKHSAWGDGDHLLHMVPAGAASIFNVLSILQEGIDQSSIPYTILVAADSMLDREELEPALARGQVFSYTSPQGLIPSEGAGGILLYNPGNCNDELWATAVVVEPVKSVGRADCDTGLGGVMSAALAATGNGAAEVGFVICDSDHRTRTSMEIVIAMGQVLPTLDPLEHRISPMEYAGAFGTAADLVNLALAAELAAHQPVLAVSTQGAQLAAVVVRPA